MQLLRIVFFSLLFCYTEAVQGAGIFSPSEDGTYSINATNSILINATGLNYQYLDMTFTINVEGTETDTVASVNVDGKYSYSTFDLSNGTTNYQISTECDYDGAYYFEIRAFYNLTIRVQGTFASALIDPGTSINVPNPINSIFIVWFGVQSPNYDSDVGYYIDILNKQFVETDSAVLLMMGNDVCGGIIGTPVRREETYMVPEMANSKIQSRQGISECALNTQSHDMYLFDLIYNDLVKIEIFRHIGNGIYPLSLTPQNNGDGIVSGFNITYFNVRDAGCPNDCSNKGNCQDGVCKCSSRFFSGPDCSQIAAEPLNDTHSVLPYNRATQRLFSLVPYNITLLNDRKKDLNANLYFHITSQMESLDGVAFFNKDFALLGEDQDGFFEMSAANGDQIIYILIISPTTALDNVTIDWSIGQSNQIEYPDRLLTNGVRITNGLIPTGAYQIYRIPGPITRNSTVTLFSKGSVSIWPKRWTNQLDFATQYGPLAFASSYDSTLQYDFGKVSVKLDPSDDEYNINYNDDLYAFVEYTSESSAYEIVYSSDTCVGCVHDCIAGVCVCKPGFKGNDCKLPVDDAILLTEGQTRFTNLTSKTAPVTYKFTSNKYFFVSVAYTGEANYRGSDYYSYVYTNYSNNPTFATSNPGYCPGDTAVLQYTNKMTGGQESHVWLTPYTSPALTYGTPMFLDFSTRRSWNATYPELFKIHKFDVSNQNDEILNITIFNYDEGVSIDVSLYENTHDCTYDPKRIIEFDYVRGDIPYINALKRDFGPPYQSPYSLSFVISRGHPVDATLVLYSAYNQTNVTMIVTKTKGKECLNNCSRIGYCNVQTGNCECPVGYQSTPDCSIPTCRNFTNVSNVCNLVGRNAPSPFFDKHAYLLSNDFIGFINEKRDQIFEYSPFGENTYNCTSDEVFELTLLYYKQKTHFVTDWLYNLGYQADQMVPYFSQNCLDRILTLICNTLYVPCVGNQIVLPGDELYEKVILNCPVLLSDSDELAFRVAFSFTSYDRTKLNYTRFPEKLVPITTSPITTAPLTTGSRSLRQFDLTETVVVVFNETTNSSCSICESDTYTCAFPSRSGKVSASIPNLKKDRYKVSGIYLDHMDSVTCSQTRDTETSIVAQVSEPSTSTVLKILDQDGYFTQDQCCKQCNQLVGGSNFATWSISTEPKILTISQSSSAADASLCVHSATLRVGYDEIKAENNIASDPKKSQTGKIVGIVLGAVLGTLLVAVIIVVVIILYRRKKKDQEDDQAGVEMRNQDQDSKPTNTIYDAVVHHEDGGKA